VIDPEAARVLAQCEVPGKCAWYLLGCRETRVTLYSQQVRALNLAWALRKAGKLIPGTQVVVIGGGAAGLTVAAALSQLNAVVTVLEQEASVLPLQRNCYKRHLHPHIYDWPNEGADDPNAGLPVLNWRAGMARDVARSIESGFDRACASDPDLTLHTAIRNVLVDTPGHGEVSFVDSKRQANHQANERRSLKYDVLVFALGFGVEDSMWQGQRGSYWADDSLDQDGVFRTGRYLVSGTGDGALIDILRISFRNFRQEDLVQKVEGLENFEALKHELLEIERKAQASHAPETELFRSYQAMKHAAPLDELLGYELNRAAKVKLVCRGKSPFSLKAALLHRLLLARLVFHFADVIDLCTGVKLEKAHLRADHAKVIFNVGTPEVFDHVVIRHGPIAATDQFPELAAAINSISLSTSKEIRALYGGTFGKEPAAVTWVGAKEVDYLQALREYCSSVAGVEGTPVAISKFREVAFEVLETERKQPARSAKVTEGTKDSEAESVAETRMLRRYGHAIVPSAHVVSGIMLLTGRAGTGKTGFLKATAMACLHGRSRSRDRTFPVYLHTTVHIGEASSPEAIVEAIAAASFASLRLPQFSEASESIRNHLRNGTATVFFDNVEDWRPNTFTQVLRWLAKAGHSAVLAGRRMPYATAGLTDAVREHEVLGLTPGSARSFLRGHFPDAGEDSVAGLLKLLRKLPNHLEWLMSPFLLSRSAGLFFSDAIPAEGLSKIGLYAAIVSEAIKRMAPGGERIEKITGYAASTLLREPIALRFQSQFDSREEREAVLRSGLVSGNEQLEFAHLSIAEYLASKKVDGQAERQNLIAQAGGWRQHLEVLSMAHAADELLLDAALEDAEKRDKAQSGDPDHRALTLLLKAIGYAGPSKANWCVKNRDRVVSEVVRRLQQPSGRFSDDERVLMRAAENAAPFLQGAGIDVRVLPLVGEPGAEAWAMRESLIPPGSAVAAATARPPSSIYWATIFYQARVFIEQDLRPAEVAARTRGGDWGTRPIALTALARTQLADDALRTMLVDRSNWLRMDALYAVYEQQDPGRLAHLFDGMLSDSELRHKSAALRRIDWTSTARRSFLGKLIRSPSTPTECKDVALSFVPIGHESQSDLLVLLHQLVPIKELREARLNLTSAKCSLLLRVMTRLSDSSDAKETIDEFFRQSCWPEYHAADKTMLALCDPGRLELLRQRFKTDQANSVEIAVAEKLGLVDELRGMFLRAASGSARDSKVVYLLRALPRNDSVTRSQRLAYLAGGGPSDDADRFLHSAAIESFEGDPTAYDELVRFLTLDGNESSARAALTALRGDPRVAPHARALLKKGPAETRIAAADILLQRPEFTSEVLQYAQTLPANPAQYDQHHDSRVRQRLLVGLVPTFSSEQLNGLIDDPDSEVREAVAKALLAGSLSSEIRAALVEQAVRETEHNVQRILWPALADEPAVRSRLELEVREDLSAVREAYYQLAANEEELLPSLRAHFEAVRADEATNRDALVELIPTLARDPEMLVKLRELRPHPDMDVRAELHIALRSDAALRDRVHTDFRLNPARLANGWGLNTNRFEYYFANDNVAKQIMVNALSAGTLHARSHVTKVLAGYAPAKAVLESLLKQNINDIPIWCALLPDPRALDELGAYLTDNRAADNAAKALEDCAEAHDRLAKELSHRDDKVRRSAYRSCLRFGYDSAALVARCDIEAEPTARTVLVAGLAAAKVDEVRAMLVRRLHQDPVSEIRKIAARALGPADRGIALRAETDHPTSLKQSQPTEYGKLEAFIAAPQELREADHPSLFSAVVIWARAKLVSTLVTDAAEHKTYVDPLQGLFGEIPASGDPNPRHHRIRLAADSTELARDRGIFPSANLLAVWDVMWFLVAKEPFSLVLACADVPFHVLEFPNLEPGAMILGPIFFGLSLRVTSAGPVGSQPGDCPQAEATNVEGPMLAVGGTTSSRLNVLPKASSKRKPRRKLST
jgi:Pyridine nucleotide-disulphide oxidoreductase